MGNEDHLHSASSSFCFTVYLYTDTSEKTKQNEDGLGVSHVCSVFDAHTKRARNTARTGHGEGSQFSCEEPSSIRAHRQRIVLFIQDFRARKR